VIKLPPPSYARRGGEIVAAQLRKIGIELEIVPVEWAQWLDQVFKKKDFHLTIVSHTEPQDINIYARKDYYFQYESAAFNKIMEDLNLATDQAARYKLMGDAQKLITDEAVNGYMFELAKAGVWNAKLKGMWENAPVQATDLTGVSWTE
jgi:peptide/nickel transport system substrate-binding protein